MQKTMRAVINDSTAYVPLRFSYDTLETIGSIRSTYRVTHTYSSKYNRNQTEKIEITLVKYGSKKGPNFVISDIRWVSSFDAQRATQIQLSCVLILGLPPQLINLAGMFLETTCRNHQLLQFYYSDLSLQHKIQIIIPVNSRVTRPRIISQPRRRRLPSLFGKFELIACQLAIKVFHVVKLGPGVGAPIVG